jgi:polyisoprenoid-binding protein YceI
MRSLILLLLLSAGPALAADWSMDPTKSRLGFAATWEGSEFDGVFRRFDPRIRFDPAAPGEGRFEVTVDVASADTQSADRDEGMAGAEWLDSARHPRATYVTSQIRALGGERYEADGTLTIKGIARPLRLPFTWTQSAGQARMQAAVVVRRTDFDVGIGEWASNDPIGIDVRVTVDLTLKPR